MIEQGEKPVVYNEPFEDIAKELIGKEGKRKVRTIIFRSFVYMQSGKKIIKPNIFIQWAKKKSLNDLKPIFLFKILMDYEITRFIAQKMAVNMDSSNSISVSLLSKAMVKEYGDRDVVKRSLRSFLTTLVHFDVLTQVDKQNYRLLEKKALSKQQICQFLMLYSSEYLKSNVLNIQNIEPEFLFFFKEIDLQAVAFKFNGKYWEYIRDINRDVLIMKDQQQYIWSKKNN